MASPKNFFPVVYHGLFAVPIAILIRDKVVSAERVRTVSVSSPSSSQHSYVAIDKLSTAFVSNKVVKQDLIIYSAPQDAEKKYLGRVIGCSNEWIRIVDERGSYTHRRVQEGYCWVEELTRTKDEDSFLSSTGRSGQVSEALVHGKPLVFLWPKPFTKVVVEERPPRHGGNSNNAS